MTEWDPNQFPLLKAELLRSQEPGFSIPAEMDQAILGRAKDAFNARRRRWRWAGRIAAGIAAAAMFAIAVRVFVPTAKSPMASPASHPQLAQAADVNHDGRVDILDAYTVARHIARNEPLDHAWDINGDGVVDQKDVDLIANLAVQVSGEGRQ
jgi:hypothetical protein